MMKQYFEMKEKYPNTILFFRLGDFYEMFFNDAKTVSRELELTLTGRECGQEERAPMCGVPFHSAESYIAKLVAKGYKVAICEQLEDPKLAKGLVKRDVIRVITPGTVVENSMLDETRNNFLCSICYEEDGLGLCFGDISTGDLTADQVLAPNSETLLHILEDRLARYSPSEILLNPQALDLTGLADFIRREAPRRGGVPGERAVPGFGPVPSAGQPPVWRPEPGPAGALRQAPGGQGVKRVVRLPLPHPNHRLGADERGGHRHRRGRHGPGHQRPAEPGADRNAAQQGEAGLSAVGAGPHQNRHGQAAYQGLAGAAPVEPGENHPAPERRGGAVAEPPCCWTSSPSSSPASTIWSAS